METTSERFDSTEQPPEEHFPCPTSHQSLMNDSLWDSYDLASLLPLKESVRENRKFGFVLRHYWIPATELRFRQSARFLAPEGVAEQTERLIDRRMARCRSNECLWREKTYELRWGNGEGEREDILINEKLCSYDCYEQTYVSARPIAFAPPAADQKEEARRQSLYRLPMLVPPGPVPIGFSWYSKVGDDYMNYHLEKEEQVGETSVLVIRREGRYTTWLPEEAGDSGNGQERAPVVTERQGVTLFAWNRGIVLEDRFQDRVVEAGESASSPAGLIVQAVTRLVRSCPTEDTQRWQAGDVASSNRMVLEDSCLKGKEHG